MKVLRTLCLLAVVLVAFGGADIANACVSGTVTAQYQTTGPFAGLYKYTADISWTTTQGLSNITLDCGFGDCPDEVCVETFMFATPGGTSDGEGGCTVDYEGEFNCNGNPSIGFTDPIIKWDALDDNGCEPGNTGSGTFCFYSNLAPGPNSALPVILVKNGQNVCSGMLTGDCPQPPCVVPVKESTLGKVKADF